MTYSIILITYNRAEILEEILQKIIEFKWDYQEFILVNNNSSDHTLDFLQEFQTKIPRTYLINSKENLGHGGGIALAMSYLLKSSHQPDYLIFLEDDSIPSIELPESLISKISNTDFSMLSTLGSITTLGRRTLIFPKPNSIQEVDFAVFDGAILRTEVIHQVGVPEGNWFMMVDDYEYCYRLKRRGLKMGVVYNDFHQILHLGAGTGFSKSSLWRGYYQERNYVFFVKKHFSWFNFFDFSIFFLKRVVGSFSAPDRSERLKLKFIGLWHGIVNKRGKTLDPTTLKFES